MRLYLNDFKSVLFCSCCCCFMPGGFAFRFMCVVKTAVDVRRSRSHVCSDEFWCWTQRTELGTSTKIQCTKWSNRMDRLYRYIVWNEKKTHILCPIFINAIASEIKVYYSKMNHIVVWNSKAQWFIALIRRIRMNFLAVQAKITDTMSLLGERAKNEVYYRENAVEKSTNYTETKLTKWFQWNRINYEGDWIGFFFLNSRKMSEFLESNSLRKIQKIFQFKLEKMLLQICNCFPLTH